jgi:aspartokinase/homoserine dehydrogenase 1
MVVVASAMRGVTDALLDVARRARSGDEDGARQGVQRLLARHLAAARELASDDRGLAALIDESFEELGRIVGGLVALGELTPSTSDAIVARGERLAAQLMTRALARSGQRAEYVDAVDVVITDGRAGDAFPDLARTAAAAERLLGPLLASGVVPVIPGFIGAAPPRRLLGGEATRHPERGPTVVTLGRGGSDLTATALGRVLGAREVRLWKDVPGLLTADPRVVPEARVIPSLHAREASELAYHGARVLHPRALIPLTVRLTGARLPRAARATPPRLVLRPFAEPLAPGTTIIAGDDRQRTGASGPPPLPVKAVSAMANQALVTLRGTGMAGVPGIAARAFAALERAGVSVALISQASSEQSICLGIPASGAAAVPPLLREAFAAEIARGEIEGVELQPAVSTLAVVGSGMAGVPGIAARLFGALADAGVNIVAIAQGSSELCVSVVVGAADAARAQQAVHAAFRLDRIGGGAARAPAHADVVLLGFGKVGRELARQLAKARAATAGAPAIEVVGVIDSRGYVFDAGGLSPRRLATLARAKERGSSLATCAGGLVATPREALDAIAEHALSRPVLVDVTAGDTSPILMAAVAHGMDLVLANKRPLAEGASEAGADAEVAMIDGERGEPGDASAALPERARVGAVMAAAAASGRRVLHEATVGAGLPVIDTVRKLRESGDTVLRIEGCPSGTLGFLFGELGRGRAFSDALRDAMGRGYTEPDPRDDLSGQDVARKAVILARLIGWKGALEEVAVESLVPSSLRDVPLDEFLARLTEMDAAWRQRVEDAQARGSVLRYRADVSPREARVGIAEVGLASSFASLTGTDNQFVFTTKRYRERPLVITGPGAGPEVTAAGVLNDVLALAGAR